MYSNTTFLPTLAEEADIDIDFSEPFSEHDLASQNIISTTINKNTIHKIAKTLKTFIPTSEKMDELIQRIIIIIAQLQFELSTASTIAQGLREEDELCWCLLIIIKSSGTSYRNIPNIEITAGRAMTLLNKAKKPFSGMDLSGIRVIGANLSYGIFDGTQFQEANLQDVKLQGAWLNNTNFTKAMMEGVTFGELPYLSFTKNCTDCRYSQDGQWLAVVAEDNIFLYDATTYAKIRIFKIRNEEFEDIIFSVDGKQLLSSSSIAGSQKYNIRFWEIETGVCKKTLQIFEQEDPSKGSIRDIALSPNGKLLASASFDHVRLWDLKNDTCQKILKGAHTVDFSPDGKLLAAGRWNNIWLWNIQNGFCQKVLESSNINCINFSPNSQLLASASGDEDEDDDYIVQLWEVKTGTLIKTFYGHLSIVNIVVFHPNGQLLASGSQDGAIRLWDITTDIPLRTLDGHVEGVLSLAFHPKGRLLISGGGYDKTCRIWDMQQGVISTRAYIGNTKAIGLLTLHPRNRNLILAGSGDTASQLWDVRRGMLLRTLEGTLGEHLGISYNHEGQLWALTKDKNIVLLTDDYNSYRKKLTVTPTQEFRSIAFSVTDEYMALGTQDNTIEIWECENNTRKRILNGHTATIDCIVFHPNNQLLASGSWDNSVRLWTIKDGLCLKILTAHTSGIECIIFSPNGQFLASAGHDTNVRLWDVESGDCLKVLRGHEKDVFTIAFDPEGWLLASGSYERGGGGDRSIKLWDTTAGKLVYSITLNTATLCLCWHRTDNELFLVTGHIDSSLRYWRVKVLSNNISLQLLWSSYQAALYLENAYFEKVQGLLKQNWELLEQRGAKGSPRELLFKLAIQGDLIAQRNLGLSGQSREDDVLVDIKIPIEWFIKAIEEKDPEILFNVANFYKNGKGVSKNYRKAFGLYEEAAKQGHSGAKVAIESIPKCCDNEEMLEMWYAAEEGRDLWKGPIVWR